MTTDQQKALRRTELCGFTKKQWGGRRITLLGQNTVKKCVIGGDSEATLTENQQAPG